MFRQLGLFGLAALCLASCGMQRGEEGAANLNKDGSTGSGGVGMDGNFDSSAPNGGTADFNPGGGLSDAAKTLTDLKNNPDMDLSTDQTSALGDAAGAISMLDRAYDALDQLPEGFGSASSVSSLFSRARQDAYQAYLALREWEEFSGIANMLYRYYTSQDIYRSYNKTTRSYYWTKDLGDWLAARGRGFRPEGVALRSYKQNFLDCTEKLLLAQKPRTVTPAPGLPPQQVTSYFLTTEATPAGGGSVSGELGVICKNESPNALLPLYQFKLPNGSQLSTLLDAGDLFRVLRKRATLEKIIGYTPY